MPGLASGSVVIPPHNAYASAAHHAKPGQGPSWRAKTSGVASTVNSEEPRPKNRGLASDNEMVEYAVFTVYNRAYYRLA